jgi:hypothetical protein
VLVELELLLDELDELEELLLSGSMVMESVFSAVRTGDPLSVALTVKEAVVAAVGIPEMVPLPARFSPAGKLPLARAHV